jgi:hypothetical protein
VDQRSSIAASTNAANGTGNGGDIQISAKERIEMGLWSNITSSTSSNGNAGSILVDAPEIIMVGPLATLSSETHSSGDSGSILVGSRSVLNLLSLSGIAAIRANSDSQGNAGAIFIQATTVELFNIGRIEAAAGGTGEAGSIFIRAQKFFSTAPASGVTAFSGPLSNGSGSIEIEAGSIELDGSFISTRSRNTSSAGNIDIRSGTLTLKNGGSILSSAISEFGGDAGSISIGTQDFYLSNDAKVETTSVSGGGGRITIDWNGAGYLQGATIRTDVESGSAGAGTISFGTPSLSTTLICNICPSSSLINPFGTEPGYNPNDNLRALVVFSDSHINASAGGSSGASGGTVFIADDVASVFEGGFLDADVSSASGADGQIVAPVAMVPDKSDYAPLFGRKAELRCGTSRSQSGFADRITGYETVEADPASLIPAGLTDEIVKLSLRSADKLCRT